MLSKSLQMEIRREVICNILPNTHLLNCFGCDFQSEILVHIKRKFFSPAEKIVLQNEKKKNIFFLVSGKLNLFVDLEYTDSCLTVTEKQTLIPQYKHVNRCSTRDKILTHIKAL